MPTLTPEQLDRLAAGLVDVTRVAEQRILERMAAALARGEDGPAWQVAKLAELRQVLRVADKELQGLAPGLVHAALRAAYENGSRTAVAELLANTPFAGEAADTAARLMPLVNEVVQGLDETRFTILRNTEDIYRQVVREAAGVQLLGTETRRKAAEHALARFADAGITGFTDKRGRQWEMGAYVEMAMRTASHRASQQGHTDQLQAQGHDLVQVSDHAQECPLCAPFEGRVLSISGAPPADGAEDVLCTLAEARSRGLNHPGCRHRLKAYFPGISPKPGSREERQLRADHERSTYEARMRQRELERGIRKWKRREAAALTPEAKAAAAQKVRTWQASLREHVQANDLKRLPYRERNGAR